MGARDLLADLNDAGVSIAVEGDRLVLRPASKITESMRAALHQAKPELLALLRVELAMPNTDGMAPAFKVDDASSAFSRYQARLLTWACPAEDAAKLAARLVQRDAESDERVSCIECRHYSPGSCWNHRPAGLGARAVGTDLAIMLQRCSGFSRHH